MNYAVFRSAVLELLEEDREWNVTKDWEESSEYRVIGPEKNGGEVLPDEFIEMEQEKGPYYVFMTISMGGLYVSYQAEGWDAVRRELEKYTRRENSSAHRNRGIDYTARLNEEGAALYAELRELRSEIAKRRNVPPYIIFMNRSLYEMCCRQPSDMEELKKLYGIGEKNSRAYGREFLDAIRKFTDGKKMQLMKVTGDEPDIDPMADFIRKRNAELNGSGVFLPKTEN